jgi:hypothetical protein
MIRERCYGEVKGLWGNYVDGPMIESRYTLAIPTEE